MSFGNDCGLSVPRIKGWILILEANYVVNIVYLYFLNISKRMVKTLYDTGSLCNLLGIKSVGKLEMYYAYGSMKILLSMSSSKRNTIRVDTKICTF